MHQTTNQGSDDMVKAKDGTRIRIRALQPEDEDGLKRFYGRLSQSTMFLRFGRHKESVSEEWIERLIGMNHNGNIAVAAIGDASHDEILGIAAVVFDEKRRRGETSVLVADQSQGKGIGRIVLEHAVSLARERGMESLWALIDVENTPARNLAKKLGFVSASPPAFGQQEFELRF
ncbi:MAG: GNAT family N-acetyltransferase [Desulfomonilaceae bacterium]|nr:GNAT family N-acetyltransferase [Desulfomonilaceae bacterium]